jgi:hypothetical protein
MARRGRKSSNRSHARHTTALAARPNVVVVRSGGRGARRRSGGVRTVVVKAARRGGRGLARHGLPMTGLAVGGAGLGYLQASGHLDFVPEIGGSKMLGLGILGYFATRMTRNKYVREAGAAAVAVAAFEFGREHGAGKKPGVHGYGGGGLGPFGGG